MLQGRAALITGSIDGIGFAIAEALARRGCAVMLNGFAERERIDQRVGQLRDLGVDADYHGADLSVPAQIEAMVGTAQRRFGRIDIAVNNAVTRTWGALDELPAAKWDYAIAVNLTAPFHVIRLVMPGMKERQWGRIINLASNYGLQATPRRGDYVATKHGLIGLTKVAALEGLPYNITANAICPGATMTPNARKLIAQRMADKNLPEDEAIVDYLATRQPSRRFIEPGRIGAFAAFLCSDDAGDITGSPLSIDGGWMASSGAS
jgi:3-hydroxybutyrate dehydrogenase